MRRRLASIELVLAPSAPGWSVRVLPGLGAAAAVAAGTAGRVPPQVLIAALVLSAVAVILVPQGPAAGVVVVALGVAVLTENPVPARTFALVLLVHLLLRLTALAAQVPWRSTVELAVVVHALREMVVPQIVAQVVALVVAATSGALGSSALLRPVAVVAVAVLVLVVLPREWLERKG